MRGTKYLIKGGENMNTYKLVVVFDKDLTEEEFHEKEIQLLKDMTKDCDLPFPPATAHIHKVRGFGNSTVITKNKEYTWHGWCDYVYFSAEETYTDELSNQLRRNKHITTHQIQKIDPIKAELDTTRILDINNLEMTYNPTKKDFFDLIFSC